MSKPEVLKIIPLFLGLSVFILLYVWLTKDTTFIKTIFDRVPNVSIRVQEGWQKDWVKPNFDDTSWDSLPQKPSFKGVIRYHIHLDKSFEKLQEPAIDLPRVIGSYHLYFDGILIGKNGEPALNNRPEKVDLMQKIFILPDSLLKEGNHLVAFYLTSGHSHFSRLQMPFFRIGEYQNLIRFPLILSSLMHVLAGIFLVIGIYYFFLFFISNQSFINLIFSSLCLLFFVLIIFEYLKFYYQYPYPFQYWRLIVIAILTSFISLLLPFYFMLQFHWNYKWQIISSLIPFQLIIWLFAHNFDNTSIQIMVLGFSYSTFIIGKEITRKTKGSYFALLSILPLWISFFWYYDLSLFIGFAFLIGVNLYSLSLQSRQERIQKEDALLKASRLEIEILKRNIQPHFLLNTLTSLIDWVEESPEVGVQFIEALGKEYEILANISHQKLIPIEQEIELCRHHMQVMAYRKEIDYQLITQNIDVTEVIPPAIFHTLIENGITHNIADNNQLNFYLNFERFNHHKTYTLLATGKLQKESTGNRKEGTGLKYIKARLEESYPQKWTLEGKPCEKGWQTVIQIKEV